MSKKNILLIFILGLALFLRIWGLDYGLPYFLINDERTLVYGALKMGELKTLIPAFNPEEFHVLYYAPLMSYLYLIFLVPFILIQYFIGSFSNFAEITSYFTINPGPVWLVARMVNALMGAAAVYLIYLIGRKMMNHWVGLISALFLTFSFLHLQFSHFTRIWGPTLFFVLLIMLLSLYIYKTPKRKYYLWMGIVGGLSFGTNYIAPAALFIFLMAHFLAGKKSFRERLRDKNLWFTAVTFILVTTIFIFIYPQLFTGWTGMGRLGGALSAGRSLTEFIKVFLIYLKISFFYEPIVSVFALAGLIFSFFKSRKIFFISLSWPIFWIFITYFILHGGEISGKPHSHYILMVIPWFILLASLAVYQLVVRFSLTTRVFMLGLIFIYPLAVALQYDYLLSQKDTRILAKEWMEDNIPAGTKILSNWGGINPTPTKEAILFQKELDEGSLRAADKALLALKDKDYPKPAYDILKLAYIDKEKLLSPEQLNNYRYFLVAFWQEEDLTIKERSIIGKARLLKEFKQSQEDVIRDVQGNRFMQPVSVLFFLERFGPTVRIYQL